MSNKSCPTFMVYFTYKNGQDIQTCCPAIYFLSHKQIYEKGKNIFILTYMFKFGELFKLVLSCYTRLQKIIQDPWYGR